jgi:hypothetical protein
MDDGNYEKYGAKIALCNFDNTSLKLFQEFLLKQWNIKTSLHKNNCIYIKAISKKVFNDLITPYIIPSMMYKINKSPQ